MVRRPGKYNENFSKERFAQLAIHGSRLKRLLPAFAERHGHNPQRLVDLAELSMFLCPICMGPIIEPKLYLVDDTPRAVLCTRCHTALVRCDYSLFKLRFHRRFNTDYRKNRGRLQRYIMLHTEGSILFPAEPVRDLVEDQRSSAHRKTGDDPEQERIP